MKNTTRTAAPLRPAFATGPYSAARALFACIACCALLAPRVAAACSGRLHIEIADSAVYALDYATIVARQPGLGDCAADDLTLLNRGTEVPIRVTGAGDGKFGAGARIEWLGQRLHGPQSWYDTYSNVNVYQLAAQPGKHARMHEVSARNTPPLPLRRSVHVEQENLMLRLSDQEMKAGDEPDIWQWAKLTPIDAQPFSADFDLPDIAPPRAGESAGLTIGFRGSSFIATPKNSAKPVDHVVEISINGKVLGRESWDGRSEVTRKLDVPLALLKDKGNRIGLRVPQRDRPGDAGNFIVDVVMFNWLGVTYPARGRIADGAAFSTGADGMIELEHEGPAVPEIYDTLGGYRRAEPAGKGRYRAAATGNTDMYAVAGEASKPALVRAIADEDLRGAAPGFDYLMVAHPRLIDAIQPLAQLHRARGLKVAVADVDAVYDEFNGGIAHPVAIRKLVEWGSEHWQVKPRYLLLVGDASADIHHDVRVERLNASASAIRPHPLQEENMLQGALSNMPTTSYTEWDPELANRNLIPTWQYPSPEGQGASDNGFVALKKDDYHPTLAVGRLPVIEPAEVKAIVDKTIEYMTRPSPGEWRREFTFVSTDEVMSFKQESERIASDLGKQGYSIKALYTKQDASEAAFANAQLKQDLDSGNLLVHFIGHGGAFIWRVGPPADLFTLDDVSKLNNAGRYPMVLAMTCFSAPFDNPTEDSIGERFLRESGRGAVAVFAASWTNSPNPMYSKALIDNLLKPDNPIGDAIVTVKATMLDETFVQMYNLLGDPALVLARPRGALKLARGADRWTDSVIVRVPEARFGGDVVVDWVDAAGATLQTRHYEARDSQFTLAVPVPQAAQVRVHASNPRTGFDALGTLTLIEPPAPKAVAIPKPVPKIPANAAPAEATAKPPQAAVSGTTGMTDRIARTGFEVAPMPLTRPHAARGPTSGPPPTPVRVTVSAP